MIQKIGFALDSALEGSGFELTVPLRRESLPDASQVMRSRWPWALTRSIPAFDSFRAQAGRVIASESCAVASEPDKRAGNRAAAGSSARVLEQEG